MLAWAAIGALVGVAFAGVGYGANQTAQAVDTASNAGLKLLAVAAGGYMLYRYVVK